MYRLMIADDEDDERRGIQFLLERGGLSFDVEEAVDGQDALDKLQQKPADLLITDVKMPFMDGIELASRARELYPDIQIVFFSGYDDFEYVKHALSLQAVDYILKPVNPEEFIKTIRFVVERMRREEEETTSSMQVKKHYTLSRLLNNVPMEKLRQEQEESVLFAVSGFVRLILLEFETDFFGKFVTDIRQFTSLLEPVVLGEFEFLDMNPSQAVLLLGKEYHQERSVRDLARQIHQIMQEHFGQICYLAISPSICAADEIGNAYAQAEEELEDRFFYREIFVYPIDKTEARKQETGGSESEILKQIEKDVERHDSYSLRQNMKLFFDEFRKNGLQSYVYTRFMCTNLLQLLCKELPAEKKRLTALVEQSYACTSFSQLEQLVWGVYEELEDSLKCKQDSPKHTIALVEKYILEHYDEILSLDILADKVYLTPHYLSSIFIQEKGIGINKYIKNVRMEKARELLLETNMKISDICEKTGYTNVSYFCRSFRNEYGVTPEQYRR